jgi:hypothetical protein
MMGVRQMKCAILIINNLGIGLNLLRPLLADAESLLSKNKDNSVSMNLNWRCLIGFECLQIVISNPNLSELFANSSLSIGAPVLIQILECHLKASKAISNELNSGHSSSASAGGAMNRSNLLSKGKSSDTMTSSPGIFNSTQKIQKVINSQNLETDVPAPSCQQIQRIIIESITTFANSFSFILNANITKQGSYSSSSRQQQ